MSEEKVDCKQYYSLQVLTDILLIIANDLPNKWRNSHGAWATHICKSNNITNSSVVKSFLKLSISLSSASNDLFIAEDLAKELSKIIGLDGSSSLAVSEFYPIINQSTSAAITSCILQLTEADIHSMDWAIKKLKTFSLVTQKCAYINDEGEHTSELAFEENLYSRAESVVKILSSFVLMNLKGKFLQF